MMRRIVATGMLFFVFLAALWQYMFHMPIESVSEMFTAESIRVFFADVFKPKTTLHLSGYEMGVYFSIFVLMQFWNLFNAKYFRTNRSLIVDVVDLFRAPRRVKESYNGYFILILAAILVGQVVIVTFAGELFNVSPLSVTDWGWILLITSPVVLFPDLVRSVRYLWQ